MLIDGSQGAVHLPVDVQDIDCDFYAFTGHKVYGPTGIGVLYGKRERLKAMPPYMGGGEMIADVSQERVTYAEPPHRFEAGTPPIVQAIGLGAALTYMESIGRERIAAHEATLAAYAHERLSRINSLTHLRRGEGQGRHRLVQHGRRPPARHLDHHRPRRRRGAGWDPLRPAAARPLRHHGHVPRVIRALQYGRRSRSPCRGLAEGP